MAKPVGKEPVRNSCRKYNALGKCFCAPCRFRHECSSCAGAQPSTQCQKGGGGGLRRLGQESMGGGGSGGVPSNSGVKGPNTSQAGSST